MNRDYPVLISVIVPVYKVEQYLDQCIQSIVDQTYRNLEIILVDDGSPDQCPAICDRWAQMDKRIKVIHKENGGLSDARNAGLEIAAGSYVGFVDSDDWLDETMYQNLLSAVCRDQSEISCCAVMKVFENGEQVHLTHSEPCVLDRLSGEIELINEGKLLNPVWYKLYKKSVLDNIRFEKGKLHEDVFFTYQVIGKANRISIIQETGYYYRQRDSSIMGNTYSPGRLDALEALERRLHFFQEAMPDAAEPALVNLWFSCLYHGQMALKHLKGSQKRQAIEYLEGILHRNPVTAEAVGKLPFKRKIWLRIAGYSYKGACLLRNLVGTGF